jgi:formylglycine-generating enzyme required for sulfatase activity
MRFWTLCLIFSLTLARVAIMPVQAADEEIVAVMDLTPQDAKPAEALAITNQLRSQLLKTGKFTLVDRSQMDAILKEQALQQSGCTSDECAVQVGKLLGVRKIVTGSVTKLSEQLWQVSLLMLDVETGKTLRNETETYEGTLITVIRTGVPDLAGQLAGIGAPARAPQGVIATPPPPPVRQQQAAVALPESGPVWRDPITGMEFVSVAGGEYEQGCHSGNGGECNNNEKPLRHVRVSPFWMAKTEVTVGQFKKFVDETGYRTESEQGGGCNTWTGQGFEPDAGANFRSPGFPQDESHPVVCVSSNDAQAFVKWLARKSGESYRLPSEAEWEFACRDRGKAIKYAWADGRASGNVADEAAKRQFSGWSIFTGYDDGYVYTAPVRSFSANGLGLFDMTGNVWEWTQDVYNDRVYQSGGDKVNVLRRAIRGGGWFSNPLAARCSVRALNDPRIRDGIVGFRLAMTK